MTPAMISARPIEALSATSSATGLRSDQDFRTNIGVVNLDIRPRTFSVDVIGERYTATVSIEVEPLSMRQIPVPRGDYGALRAVFIGAAGGPLVDRCG